ncbi:hypothetical protein, partial [Novosphingobium sp. 11B]
TSNQRLAPHQFRQPLLELLNVSRRSTPQKPTRIRGVGAAVTDLLLDAAFLPAEQQRAEMRFQRCPAVSMLASSSTNPPKRNPLFASACNSPRVDS